MSLVLPGLALTTILGFITTVLMWLKVNSAGLFGLFICIAGLFHMIGVYKLSKLILPLFVVIVFLKLIPL